MGGQEEKTKGIEDLKNEIDKLKEKEKKLEQEMIRYRKKAKNKLLEKPNIKEWGRKSLKLVDSYEWAKYKNSLYDEWRKENKGGLSVRNPSKDTIPSRILNIVLILITLVIILLTDMSLSWTISILLIACITKQLVMLLVSTYVYVVSPNKKLRNYYERLYKELDTELQDIKSQLRLKGELLQAAKSYEIRH